MHIHVLILSSAEHPQCQEKQEAQKLLIKPTKKLTQYTLSFCSIEMHTKTNKYFQIFFFSSTHSNTDFPMCKTQNGITLVRSDDLSHFDDEKRAVKEMLLKHFMHTT